APAQALPVVDGLYFFDSVSGSGDPFDSGPNAAPWIYNLTAEDMLPTIAHQLSTTSLFNLQQPVLTGEGVTNPFDGNSTGNGNLSVVDNQEPVYFFEAQMRSNLTSLSQFFFPWALDLNQPFGSPLVDADVLQHPAMAHAIANWFGGDPDFFEPCLTATAPD